MPYYPGRYWQICEICGWKRYNTEMRKNWKHQVVCRDTCWEPRHPQDYAKPKADKQYVPDPRPQENTKPTIIETVAASSITSTTAESGGNVTHDGDATVTAYGVCWATSHAPTTDDSSTSDGTGTGEFTSSLTGLSASTTYYVRAYATNSVGTAYGPEIEFTTSA